MGKITGITVNLIQLTETGTDPFGAPIYAETSVPVENVLIGEPTTDEITDSTEVYGKRIAYMLGIPKGDQHDWTDTFVEFFGERFRTFGFPIQGIEQNIPLKWHKKVRVERYG